ncbi:putative 26S proteasome non-ATPase regulatory subunit 9 [Babesia divergens]|uniref:26S proteasome non-ATPase regulatory subunit 9 n=1 Tax=Babesia divergens TaxID=32595 RepID=A0AAD9GHD3_BABDI|nr:putative 26S proteasome non-ATPase regulatory subunit 9 [Babesia divergens]
MDNINVLIKKKEDIETEMEALISFLNSDECKNVGMKGALVDNEQFPRSDIDIYAVRDARHRVYCLQNDYKSVEAEIEKALHQIHQKL